MAASNRCAQQRGACQSANDLGAYIVSGVQLFDAKSAVSRKYLDYFSDTALTLPPFSSTLTSAYGRQRYDAFGRQLQTFDLDGTVTLQSVYHALSSDLYDAADLENGPHQGSYASTRSDGHGRTIATTERIHVSGAIEAREVRTRSVVLDRETSELVEASSYQGYGAKETDYRPDRWKAFRDDYGFTGKEEDAEFGIVYFGKRFYSSQLNRWITADPLAVHAPGEADLNLYAYVHGTVLRSVDPLGLEEASTSGPPPPRPGADPYADRRGECGSDCEDADSKGWLQPADADNKAPQGSAATPPVHAPGKSQAKPQRATAKPAPEPEQVPDPGPEPAGPPPKANQDCGGGGNTCRDGTGSNQGSHAGNEKSRDDRMWYERKDGKGKAGPPPPARRFGALSQAGKFGIQPYRALAKALKGTGLQAHHLIEKRFAGVMGQNVYKMASVAVTPAEHQVFTNAWRALIPLGESGTGAATRESVMQAARQIYAKYPQILEALEL